MPEQKNPIPQKQSQNQPKKQDETRKHAPNQGPDLGAPGHPDHTGERTPLNPKIQAPQK